MFRAHIYSMCVHTFAKSCAYIWNRYVHIFATAVFVLCICVCMNSTVLCNFLEYPCVHIKQLFTAFVCTYFHSHLQICATLTCMSLQGGRCFHHVVLFEFLMSCLFWPTVDSKWFDCEYSFSLLTLLGDNMACVTLLGGVLSRCRNLTAFLWKTAGASLTLKKTFLGFSILCLKQCHKYILFFNGSCGA